MAKRKIGVFIAGCPVCEPVEGMVQSMPHESCDVTIYILAEQYNPIPRDFLLNLRGKQVTSYETSSERLSRKSLCCLHFCYYRFHQ